MPYPMMEWPEFSRLRRQLAEEFGCRFVVAIDEDDDEITVIERDVGEETRRYGVYYADEERLAPTVVGSICAHLRVDPTGFGLTIG